MPLKSKAPKLMIGGAVMSATKTEDPDLKKPEPFAECLVNAAVVPKHSTHLLK